MNPPEAIYEFILIFGTGLMFMCYSTISKKKSRPLLENIEFVALLNIAVVVVFGAFVSLGICVGQIHPKHYWFPLTALSIVMSIVIIGSIFFIKQNDSYKLLSEYMTKNYDGINSEEASKFCQLHDMDYFPVIFFEQWCKENGERETLDSLNKLSLELTDAKHLFRLKDENSDWKATARHINKK